MFPALTETLGESGNLAYNSNLEKLKQGYLDQIV